MDSPSPLQWHGFRDELQVGDFRIRRPLVYSASGPSAEERSAVLPELEAARLGKRASLNPTPGLAKKAGTLSYAGFTPVERLEYLLWLSDGRPDFTRQENKLLFLAGLERRAFGEQGDVAKLWNEVWRLWNRAFPSETVFLSEARGWLWRALKLAGGGLELAQVLKLAQSLPTVDVRSSAPDMEHLAWFTEWCQEHLGGLSWGMALLVARAHAHARENSYGREADPDLQELFQKKFQERWGELATWPLTTPPDAQTTLHFLNSTLSSRTVAWRHPLATGSQRKNLLSLVQDWNQVLETLRPRPAVFIRGSNLVFRQSSPAPFTTSSISTYQRLQDAYGEVLAAGKPFLVSLSELAKALELKHKPQLEQMTARNLARSLEQCDLAIEPDARLSDRSYRWGDTVALFLLPDTDAGFPAMPEKEARVRYLGYRFVLGAGTFVAAKAGLLTDEILGFIIQTVASACQLTEPELARLQALTRLWSQEGPSALDLRPPLAPGHPAREATKRLILELARQSPQVSKLRPTLELVWKRMLLDPEELSEEQKALAALIASAPPPIRGTKSRPVPVLAPGQFLELDRQVLAGLLDETRHVQATLAAAMTEATEAPGQDSMAANPAAPEVIAAAEAGPSAKTFPGLPPRYAPFLQSILRQPQWPKQEAEELARGLGLMLAGSIEAVNEWALEELGGQLLWEEEEGGVLYVESGVLESTSFPP